MEANEAYSPLNSKKINWLDFPELCLIATMNREKAMKLICYEKASRKIV